LGTKLLLSIYEHFNPDHVFSKFLASHAADWGVSILTVAVFFVPVITSQFFNWPRHNK